MLIRAMAVGVTILVTLAGVQVRVPASAMTSSAVSNTSDPRLAVDAESDAIVAGLMERGQVPAVNKVLDELEYNGQPVPAELPAELRAFVQRSLVLPDLADRERLARAQKFFQSKDVYIMAIIGLGALGTSAAVPAVAKAVARSEGGKDVRTRLVRTARLGFDLLAPGAFEPKGKLLVTALKIRLIHSAVRYLLGKSGRWDQKRYGAPLNQDLMRTEWGLLSINVLDQMARIGVDVTAQEKEDYLYTWRIAGGLLGIDQQFLPTTPNQARTLHAELMNRHQGRSAEGVYLAGELVNVLSEPLGTSTTAKNITAAAIRYFTGDNTADLVDLPRSGWDGLVALGLPAVVRIREESVKLPGIKSLTRKLEKALTGYAMHIWSRGKNVPLHMPVPQAR